jgi:hypothetical protein
VDENLLRSFQEIFKSTILRKIFGPVKNGVWGIRTKQELIDVYKEPDIISEIGKGKVRWVGHVERM